MARREPPHKRVESFLREVWTELTKVIWPGQSEILNYTGLVIGMIIVVGGFFTVLDRLFQFLTNMLGLYR